MTTEISIKPDQGKFDDTQRAALESLGIAEAPEGDQQLFLHVAQRSGLDPFAKQIYLIPRWDGKAQRNKWTIQTSIDGLRVIRDRIGKFEGLTTEWCGQDGVWRDVWLSKDKPAAARVSVYVKGFQVPVRGIALWREYAQTLKSGDLTAMWAGKSTVMIAKCAEAIAYRQAFPQDFSGLYVAEEMPAAGVEQDHDGPNVRETMRDAIPNQNRTHNRKTEAPQRDAGHAAPFDDGTAAGPQRPGGSRAASKPATGSADRGDPVARKAYAEADEARDKGVVALEWASRIIALTALDQIFPLHDEAANRGVLDHRIPDGGTLEELFLDKRAELQDAAQQTQAGEPEEPVLVPDYDDETLF